MVLRALWRLGDSRRVKHHQGCRRSPGDVRKLRVEGLETREMLSLSVPGYAVPMAVPYLADGLTAPMATAGPTGMTPTQIRHAYGFDKISFANGTIAGDGSGTTIAIVDAYDDPNILNDLKQFDKQFGLPDPVFTKVSQTGSTTALPAADAGWATEIALDVEWAHAIAPKANILLVEANDNSLNNLFSAVDYARSAAGVVAVSMSWGGSDFSGESSYDSHFTTPAGHAGVTFLASSGDSGAPVGYPAISSNVVAVGGTTLSLSSGNYLSESGWSGSGGGISRYETQPSYQKGIVTQTGLYRANPDVAYDANPSTGFAVYDSYNNGTSTPWGQWGGTSDAAPQWAGLVAIADQGRALAGRSSLDGATQTLPLLYTLPSSDFHDVTSGTSTGSPTYTASAGYDLVTGRGSPYANLVVAGLVGQAAASTSSHFAVTAPTTATSGTTFSITVSALDSSNNVIPGYLGTVHFSSSDAAAVAAGLLPADYTFTSTDRGVHTFNLALATAGTESVTVTDKSNSALVASASLTVQPGAVTHLAFGQQPSTVSPGVAISPAVTVRLLDRYNNLVTTDSSHVVSMAIGTNPGGGTLSGTTQVTASKGVATFSNLSINKLGTGYTLVATSGTMKVTSNAFNVASNVIESFETVNNYYIAGGTTTATAARSTAAVHDGTYGLLDSPGTDWVFRNDAAAQVKSGSTLSVWLKFSNVADGRAYFGFGASATGALSLVAAPNTNQLILQNNSGWGYSDMAAASQAWLANHWYRLEVSWGSGGTIVGKLYDSNGTTLLRTVTATNTTITSGGIAFRATGSNNKYWDTVTVKAGASPAATQALASAATPVSKEAVREMVHRDRVDGVPEVPRAVAKVFTSAQQQQAHDALFDALGSGGSEACASHPEEGDGSADSIVPRRTSSPWWES